VGHAGTLDPFATGLLIVAVGRDATRRISEFTKLDKEYIATAHLGASSTTDDLSGTIMERSSEVPTLEQLSNALLSLRGSYEQVVPAYAAKKVDGKKLYEYARAGKDVPRITNAVTVHEIELVSYNYPTFTFRVSCSSGTYVRAIARDVGEILGTGAYLTELRRTKIGTYTVTDAHPA
jgi:tRNA pseudouridine55 synthase